MKLKDIIQITVFTVIAFVLGMAVSMGTGMLGTVSLYVASGFSALVIAPPFVVMAKKVKKKPSAFIFGNYESDKRVAVAIATGMFIISMHAMTFVKVLGPEKLVEVFTVFSPEQAQHMYTFFTPKAMLISIIVNIVLVTLAGLFGMYINNKFFEKRKEKGIL